MPPSAAEHRLHVTVGEAVAGSYPVSFRRVDGCGAVVAESAGRFGLDELPELPSIVRPGPSEPQVKKAGLLLYDLLDAAGLAAAWQVPELCPLLLDVRAQELEALPWELLRTPQGVVPFRDAALPAARARLPFTDRAPRSPLPVHLLVIVGDPGDAGLATDDEIDAIHEGLRGSPCCWQVEVLTAPTERALYEAYPEIAPDIVHVIGHGIRTSDGPGVQMCPPGAPPWNLTADFITGAMLSLPTKPRLAVLNACRTADEPNKASRLARALTSALLERDTSAVVAMQGDVASGSSAIFTRALYRALAARRPLDEAVVAGRAAVCFTDGVEPRDWALPVAELATAPDAVLGPAMRVDPVTVINTHRGFRSVGYVVDRAQQRRTVQRRVERTAAAPAGDSLLLVTGGRRVGKTALMRSCVVALAVRGDGVVHHSLEERGTVCAADFVLGIVDAARCWLGPWAAQRCAETAAALRATFARAEPGAPPPGPADLADLALYTPARPNVAFAPTDDAYRSLQALLVSLARTQPFVLVLDHVGKIDERAAFVRGLLAPAAESGGLPGVQVVVVEGSERLSDLLGDPVAGVAAALGRQITVPPFGAAEAPALVREYLTRIRPDPVDTGRWATMRANMLTWATEKARVADGLLEPESILNAARYHADLAGIAMDSVLGAAS